MTENISTTSSRTASEITLRRARTGDAADLHALALGLARSHGDPDDILNLEDIGRLMLEPGAAMTVFVACDADTLVGYIALLPSVESSYASAGLYVSDLYVDEGYRGNGIGRKLMIEAASHAKTLGGSHLWLTVMPGNGRVERFYGRIADTREPVVAFAVTGKTFEALAEAGGAVND